MRDRTHAILISIGAGQIQEQGWRYIVGQFREVNLKEDWLYYYRMANIPKDWENIIRVYIVAGGRIRWTARVVMFIPGPYWMEFARYCTHAKNWLVLQDFEPVRARIQLRGFQGFRYLKANTPLYDYDSAND